MQTIFRNAEVKPVSIYGALYKIVPGTLTLSLFTQQTILALPLDIELRQIGRQICITGNGIMP